MTVISTPMAALLLAGGMVALGLGASWLVDGAQRLALRLGLSPMVVGITVVGFGTSMPELVVSVLAAMRDSAGLALGNAVGSNIQNLLLVLGTAALLSPMQAVGGRKALARDLLFGLLPAVVIVAFAWDGHLSRPVALVLITTFAAFMCYSLWAGRSAAQVPASAGGKVLHHLALTLLGIAVLIVGAELMVRGGVAIARQIGISDAVIGLTLVAFGTSLPELATSLVAALKGQAEISVGNILGSNIFNLGLIVGTAFTIRPNVVPPFVVRQDLPFLVAITAIVGLVVLRDGRVSRREGAVMLGLFALYLVFLVIRGG